ncbi:hypothetical protein CALCODRAFT_495874 [Calocera cornea HHB12733]|uniref:Uncharacterized protein n=1 Tax=Calocera cornea HHB12733 TaxID=1353952 RepID=A0A165G5V2_9BASI|nr:hypothetical protein CALCODRAFT_495874 [Calocera cornea HHB12733]
MLHRRALASPCRSVAQACDLLLELTDACLGFPFLLRSLSFILLVSPRILGALIILTCLPACAGRAVYSGSTIAAGK